MELRFGAARHPQGSALWERIARDLLPRVTILAFAVEEAMRAGVILADLEARGQRIGIEDALIAATAWVHGLRLVTRNVRHLQRVEGVAVENWW